MEQQIIQYDGCQCWVHQGVAKYLLLRLPKQCCGGPKPARSAAPGDETVMKLQTEQLRSS